MHSRRIQEKVKKDYNKIAKSFADTRQFPWKDFDVFLRYYRGDEDVLDLGCGNGRLLKFLKKNGFEGYLGVDQSEGLLEIASKDNPDQKFLLADMAKLPPLGQKYDAIFAIASFHHIPPHWQKKTLENWRALLKPGAYLFMTNWNLHQPRFWSLLFKSFILPSYGFGGLLIPWKNSVKRYYFAFTKRRLSRLLDKAGYEIKFHEYLRDGKSAGFIDGKNIVTIARNENS